MYPFFCCCCCCQIRDAKTCSDLCALVYLKANNLLLLLFLFSVVDIVFLPKKKKHTFDFALHTRRALPACVKLRADVLIGKMNAPKGGFVNAVAQNVSPGCQILMLLLNPPALFHHDDLSKVDSP